MINLTSIIVCKQEGCDICKVSYDLTEFEESISYWNTEIRLCGITTIIMYIIITSFIMHGIMLSCYLEDNKNQISHITERRNLVLVLSHPGLMALEA